MSYLVNIRELPSNDLIFRGITDITVLLLHDGTEVESSHHGWPFDAYRLKEEGKLAHVSHRFLSYNKDADEFDYKEPSEQVEPWEAMSVFSKRSGFWVISCATI